MKKNILLILVVVLSLAIFSSCGNDDSACDRAKENAAQECEGKGYEARNCSVRNREKDIWGKYIKLYCSVSMLPHQQS